MVVRDDVRQLATKKAQAFTPDPNLTPVAPTEFVGNRTPDTRKPNKGLKRLMVGPGGDWGNLASPKWWATGLEQEAKKTFYDPSKRFAAAVDPGSGASVADRIAGVAEGTLYAMDVITPFLPEGAMLRGGVRAVEDIGLNAPAPRPVVTPTGVEFPRNPMTVRYESAMRDLAERYGGRNVTPSIQVQGSQMKKILDAGSYDPTLAADAGHIGMVNRVDAALDPGAKAAAERYAAVREQIHSRTGGPVYGHLRDPRDVATASSYRDAKGKAAFGNTLDAEDVQKFWDDLAVQGIIDFKPKPGATVAPGNSFYLYQAARDQYNLPAFEKMLMPYDETLPAVVTGSPTPQVYVDALDAAIPGMGSSYTPTYAEIQTQPVDVGDMRRLTVLRDEDSARPRYMPRASVSDGFIRRPNAVKVLARNRALAEQARAAGLDVVTGTTRRGTQMLTARDADQLRETPGFIKMLGEQFFIPDRVALDQIPIDQYRTQLRELAKIIGRQRRTTLKSIEDARRDVGDMFLPRGDF